MGSKEGGLCIFNRKVLSIQKKTDLEKRLKIPGKRKKKSEGMIYGASTADNAGQRSLGY